MTTVTRPTKLNIPDNEYTVLRSGKRYKKKSSENKTKSNNNLADRLFIPSNLNASYYVYSDLRSVFSHVLYGLVSAYLAFSLNQDSRLFSTPETYALATVAYILSFPKDTTYGLLTVLYGILTGSVGIALGTFMDYYKERPKLTSYFTTAALGVVFTSLLTKEALLRTDTSKPKSLLDKSASSIMTVFSFATLVNAWILPRPFTYSLFVNTLSVTSAVYVYYDTKNTYRKFDESYAKQTNRSIMFSAIQLFVDLSLLGLATYLTSLKYSFW